MQRRKLAFQDEEEDEYEDVYGGFDEFSPLNNLDTPKPEPPKEKWDEFTDNPRKADSGSTNDSYWIDKGTLFLKLFTYVLVFSVVLAGAIISKGTLLLMTSQIGANTTRRLCNKDLDIKRDYIVHIPTEERVLWIWSLTFVYLLTQLGIFARSLRKCIFKTWQKPKKEDVYMLVITESLPAIGSAILVFVVLPELDVIKGAMLTNAFCFVPAFIGVISSNPRDIEKSTKMTLNMFCLIIQASAFVMWPLLENKPILYCIPVSVIFISFGWWENFVDDHSKIVFIKRMAQKKKEFENSTYYIYVFVAPLSALLFFCTMLLIIYLREGELQFLFDSFKLAFSDRRINATELMPVVDDLAENGLKNVIEKSIPMAIEVTYMTPIYLVLINVVASYACFTFSKFACKVQIQSFSFAFPLNLAVPALLSGLIAMSGAYVDDECSFNDTIPAYLFFAVPPLYELSNFIGQQHAWIWLVWLLSQAWITVHIWTPKCRSLARTEHLFIRPMYDAFLVDQSIVLNRRRDDSPSEHATVHKDNLKERPVTKIFACATMWHENADEMKEFFKSVFRLDQDQSAYRIAKDIMHCDVPNFYELETNIYFDDAFVRYSKDDDDPQLNEFVELVFPALEDSARDVHGTDVKLKPIVVCETPYGGTLEWTLPGRTKLIMHLKDKAKIRVKKRWSQVMYMYQLLGFRLMDNDEVPIVSKEAVARNTYILALDGDIDFQPDALHLLIEYMRRNDNLGAACGRIHPVGAGAIAWYQMFEYAVGHWFQKATEHVIGCVLCSPGCFSLFRGQALMQDSVMRKYTTTASEPRHYVQYDQGEDRWLCTLLLQKGFRVEYSAASDAYTHCPEGFNEFYNQRRRWIPSTMANILDLLADYKHVIQRNDNISMLYIVYQIVLMVGSIIGPGSIFLMLVGGFVSVFKIDQWTSFGVNFLPVLFFVLICATCSDKIQLFFAGVMSTFYGLVMMAVLVGVIIQISEDGALSPSSLFLFFTVLEFVVAGILHPKEVNCLKYGVIYFVTVPSMYMLLIIYSVFNMNNVSWGTREVTVAPKRKTDEVVNTPVVAKKDEKNKLWSFLGVDPKEDSGSIEFSLAGLYKCFWFPKQKEVDPNLKAINRKLDILYEKLEAKTTSPTTPAPEPSSPIEKTPSISSTSSTIEMKPEVQIEKKVENPEDIVAHTWFYNENLKGSQITFLNDREETFWITLIEKYLTPIDDTDKKEKIAQGLKDLRDKMVFSFFMLNALYVLTIFLLTLEKNTIHIDWPFNPQVNFTYVMDRNEIYVYQQYLTLEPIGFVFLIFFGLLLVVQSIGMFIHRYGTFEQVICNTKIGFNTKKVKDSSDMGLLSKDDALQFAKDMQRLRDIDKNDNEPDEDDKPVARRNTVHAMAMRKNDGKPKIYDLEDAFRERMKLYNTDEAFVGPVPRKTVMKIHHQMEDVRRKTQLGPIRFGKANGHAD